jgi:DNA-binding transcriptional LysR family regulator
MDIHQLRLFASVFRNRSFSRASEEMSLTQPTVSNHIKTLEAELGCRLFDRLGRTIVPTKEAETLYSHAIEIIEKADAVKDIIGQLKKEPAGELIIGASTIPGTYLLPYLMASFRNKYPEISFQILIGDSKDIIRKLLSHEIRLGIVGSKLSDDKLAYANLVEDELIIVSSPALTSKNTISFSEFLEMPFVLREEGSGTRIEIEKIFISRGIGMDTIKTVGVFGSTDAIKQAVKSGMGVSIISRLAVQDELKYKVLKELRITDMQMKRNFYLVTYRKRSLPAAYTLFSDYAMSQVKKF